MGIPGDGLNGLPTELLCNIFWLTIGRENTRQDRCRLMLVCRQWREYVEDSAFLWTDVDARDGLTNIRRALERSNGALLDLRHWFHWGNFIGLEAFMVEVGPHIARWRSLAVGAARPPPSENFFAPLTTTQAPSLEILKLWVTVPNNWMSTNTITLFGGAPAPSTLKELALRRIPVAFEPLKLSGLELLDLKNVPSITTPQLLEILLRSHSLKTLTLDGKSGFAASRSQASNIGPIELPKLVYLTLRYMSHDGANCILSNIRIPNRRCVLIRSDMSGAGALFTSTIAHLLHTTTPTGDIPSSNIKVERPAYDEIRIEFRGIKIELEMDGEDRTQEILHWLADGLGSEAAECPVHLILDCPYYSIVALATVPPPLIVKHLSISYCIPESSREALYIAMARAPDPTSSGWLHPHLESLCVGFMSMASQERLVSMLRSRYEVASVSSESESRWPVGLRSVELRGSPRTGGLVEEIKGIVGEANVFWSN